MKTTRTLTRARLLVLAGLLASTLAAPSSVADTPDPSRVTGADLPQVKRADNIFPFLEGGKRGLIRGRQLEIARGDCVHQSSGYQASSVRFANFLTPRGESPYFEGLEDPTFVVYEFANPARARKGYLRIVSYVERCAGTFSSDGSDVTVHRIGVPDLGQRQIGYRTTDTNGGLKRDLEVYVLNGKRIERSWIQMDTQRPSKQHAIRMARLLADTAR